MKNGKLPVPFHRTITGRVMVLTDDEQQDKGDRVHPFSQAYAEALNLPAEVYSGATYYSPLLDAWGRDLYDSVDVDLRPAALHLAIPAACNRPKRDVFFRLADWLGRVEPAAWYVDTGFLEAAKMFPGRPVIVDADSFLRGWPTGAHSFEWRDRLDKVVDEYADQSAARYDDAEPAVEMLAEYGLVALDTAGFVWRRESMRNALDPLSRERDGDRTLQVHGPDRGDLWDLKALLNEPMYTSVRPLARATARMLCAQSGIAPDDPAPADGHPVYELGYGACKAAVRAAIAPLVHAAHVREMEAFRLVALGKSFPELGEAVGNGA
ncbi:hypothetical protein E0H50_13710 [Kribbella sindirgiensis]|uniref:Uncharacterized protein n=1 Tax=Kribbella sindirgiensis TaxID=1124744 RepID=A0A4V2M478_9ACTN|nr:hypothetical protein E0H50_13710 [Kribbella sindirgiensis]